METADEKLGLKDLSGKVAIITGSSRGIGRRCALTLARLGCAIVIAAKTVKPNPKLPGTIYSVAAECRSLGVQALSCQMDLRDLKSIERCVQDTIDTFGRVDIVINNASALWWYSMEETPMKKFDLIVDINTRGHFALTSMCLPYMKKNGWGRVISMSPPIDITKGLKNKVAYCISKVGMSIVALGAAAEYPGVVSGNTLWPATIIESYASKNFKMGDRRLWRKAKIIADAAAAIICEDSSFSGNMLIDDTYLKEQRGFTKADLVQYRCDPNVEPPRLLSGSGNWTLRRGNVKKLSKDQASDRAPGVSKL